MAFAQAGGEEHCGGIHLVCLEDVCRKNTSVTVRLSVPDCLQMVFHSRIIESGAVACSMGVLFSDHDARLIGVDGTSLPVKSSAFYRGGSDHAWCHGYNLLCSRRMV